MGQADRNTGTAAQLEYARHCKKEVPISSHRPGHIFVLLRCRQPHRDISVICAHYGQVFRCVRLCYRCYLYSMLFFLVLCIHAYLFLDYITCQRLFISNGALSPNLGCPSAVQMHSQGIVATVTPLQVSHLYVHDPHGR